MKKGKITKGLAGLLALTVLVSSVFVVAIKYDVFGAVQGRLQPNNYVDESVGPVKSSVSLKRTDSNIKKTTSQTFNGWDPNKVIDGETDLPTVPNQEGVKGSASNPFVLLEIVPDKSMMELPYFAGNKESGLPYDPAEVSAAMVMDARKNNGDSTLRFTNEKYKGNTVIDNNGMLNKFNNYLKTKYGDWAVMFNYEIFNPGDTDDVKDGRTKLLDPVKKQGKTGDGSFNFNELYSFDIDDDDLLDSYPTSWDAPSTKGDYSYREDRNEGKDQLLYYTDQLIALAKRDDTESTPSKKDVEDFITKYITNVHLENFKAYNTNVENGINIKDSNHRARIYDDETKKDKNGNKVPATKISKDIKKYNLQDFVKAKWALRDNVYVKQMGMSYEEAEKKAKIVAQDVTNNDMKAAGDIDYYEAAQGIMNRGADATTLHKTLNISNYWKVQFRKYYVDRFNELYNKFRKAQDEYDASMKNYNGDYDAQLQPTQRTLLEKRNECLRHWFAEYEPMFTKLGINLLAMQDTYDWEITDKDKSGNTLYSVSDYRRYEARERGGYIMAVRPGKGVMYLLNEEEIKNLMKTMSEEEIKKSGLTTKSFIFVRDDKLLIDKDPKRKRWAYISWDWGINGDAEPSSSNEYRTSILDDADLTAGFASKSVIDGSHYWMAIYDRKNRRFHGNNNNGRSGYDQISYKMFEKTNQVSDKAGYQRISGRDIPEFTYNGKKYHDDQVNRKSDGDRFYHWAHVSKKDKRGSDDDEANFGKRFPLDDYHLNIQDAVKSQWKLSDDQINQLKSKDYLILDSEGDKNGQNKWTDCFGKKQENFIHTMDKDEKLTGLTLNFNTDDTYDYSKARHWNNWEYGDNDEQWRYIPVDGKVTDADKRNNPDYGKYGTSDAAVTVSKKQLVAETKKKYHFIYYGYEAAPVLQQTFFKFDTEDEYKNFHFKVICATPAELNKIYAASKNDPGKIDLVERADMYYIHTTKTKTYQDTGHDDMVYDFYNKFVKAKSEPNVTYEKAKTFDNNDLEWELCQKIIKRSSDRKYGANLPIMFNMLVAKTAEESETGDGKQDDVTSYVTTDRKNQGYMGTEINIAKMFEILIQFDLRIQKGDEYKEKNKTYTVKRTFMGNIYDYLETIPVSQNRKTYDPFTKKTSEWKDTKVPGTATMTGCISEYEIAGKNGANDDVFTLQNRALCTNGDQQNKERVMYLWNKYTFYPWNKSTLFDAKSTKGYLIENGYQYWYIHETNWGNESLFELKDKYYYATGSNGEDGQNVYVLHHAAGDANNEHGFNMLFNHISDKEGPEKINSFFRVGFKIMNTDPEGNLKISAENRKNVYTKLSPSLVWMDYKRRSTVKSDKEKYTEDELKKPLDIKCSAVNTNNRDAYITKVYFRKSSNINDTIPASVGGFDYLYTKARSGPDTEDSHKWAMNELFDKNGKKLSEDSEVVKKYGFKGFVIRDNKDFFVTYNLDNFYNGYDQLVFEVREVYAKKEATTGGSNSGKYILHEKYKEAKNNPDNKPGEIVIDITERELFNLE